MIITDMWPETEKTQELLIGVQEGNADAVNRLLERHRESVRRMVQMRLDQKIRRRVGVSDVVQNVMIEINRRLGDYLSNPQLSFHLWIRQITKDRIIDAHRRHRGSAKRSVDKERPLVGVPAMDRSTIQLAAQLRDGEQTPATAATQRELARILEQAIGQLGEQDQEMIAMRHYEQLSNQEVAEVLGLSEPAASMRYLRAVRRMRELLASLYPESE